MSGWVVTIVHVSVINNGANESLRLIHRNRRSLPTTAPNPGQPGPEKVLILGWATTRLSSCVVRKRNDLYKSSVKVNLNRGFESPAQHPSAARRRLL